MARSCIYGGECTGCQMCREEESTLRVWYCKNKECLAGWDNSDDPEDEYSVCPFCGSENISEGEPDSAELIKAEAAL